MMEHFTSRRTSFSAKNPSSRWLVPGTQRRRWWKKVGLGFKTPKSAIQELPKLPIQVLTKKMFKYIALIASLASAAAFAPAARSSSARSASLKMGFESEIGAQAPLGFWDPLGLLKDADQERFDRLRTVETKHGRISMLAILGHLVTTAGVRLPGEIAYGVPFSSVKNGLAALDTIPAAGVAQIIAFIGLIELGFAARKDDIEAAQLKASGWDQETINKKLAIELNNGRAAQMGILALMVHEKLNNDPYIINTLLGAPVPFN